MHELSRYLFLAGGLPFVFLGAAHAFVTPIELAKPKGLSPRDPGVAGAMSQTSLLLTRRVDMWRAWVGFNFSHSLGAVAFGVVVLLIGRSPASFTAEGPIFVPLAVLISGIYLVLGSKYWFRAPIIGIALSVVLFLCSWGFFWLVGA
jgi:hypothetical protein